MHGQQNIKINDLSQPKHVRRPSLVIWHPDQPVKYTFFNDSVWIPLTENLSFESTQHALHYGNMDMDSLTFHSN